MRYQISIIRWQKSSFFFRFRFSLGICFDPVRHRGVLNAYVGACIGLRPMIVLLSNISRPCTRRIIPDRSENRTLKSSTGLGRTMGDENVLLRQVFSSHETNFRKFLLSHPSLQGRTWTTMRKKAFIPSRRSQISGAMTGTSYFRFTTQNPQTSFLILIESPLRRGKGDSMASQGWE
jgi:hypothetical protein